MELKEIDLSQLKTTTIKIKEGSPTASKKLLKSLDKYGQIYPIIVNKDYEIIKGENVLEAIKILKWTKVLIKVLDVKNKIEMFNIKKLLFDSQDNLDILKVSLIIKNFSDGENVNVISEKTGINMEELINYIDLLKLDNLIKQKQEKKQAKLF